MTVHLVTTCLDIGRRFRHRNPITFDFYRENLKILANLGLPLHVFAERETLEAHAGNANVIPHEFGIADIRKEPWSAAASALWASDDWQNRFAWMKESNAPELMCEWYCQLTSMKLDMLADVADEVPPETVLVFVDCHDSAMHYRGPNFLSFEKLVHSRIHLHSTRYNWENEELHGMRWNTMEPHACPKAFRPQMHLMAGIMAGRAGTFREFMPTYAAVRYRLFERDLGTEQSILTAIYFREPAKWFNVQPYPRMFQLVQS